MAANDFDFKAYNAILKDAGAGLKLALAEGLLKDALRTLENFNNPLADDAQMIFNDVKVFRVKYKAAAAARNAKAESPAPMDATGN
jgi:hypothetical protein